MDFAIHPLAVSYVDSGPISILVMAGTHFAVRYAQNCVCNVGGFHGGTGDFNVTVPYVMN